MAISLTHTTVAVGTDAGNGEIAKTQWNEAHTLTMATDRLLGRATAGAGAVEEITCTAAGRAILDDADAAAQIATLGAAPLASPTFTGTPAAPTASTRTNTTQLATTEFVFDAANRVQQNAQTGTTYGPVATDAGKMVTLSNAAAITVTVSSATHAAGDRIDFVQKGAGQVTFVGSGVTINSSGAKLKLTGQYSGATLWFESSTVAYLVGDISA